MTLSRPAARRSVFVNRQGYAVAPCAPPPFRMARRAACVGSRKSELEREGAQLFKKAGALPRTPGIFEGKMMGVGCGVKMPLRATYRAAGELRLYFLALPPPALNSVLRYRRGRR